MAARVRLAACSLAALAFAPHPGWAQLRPPRIMAPPASFGWCQFEDVAAGSVYYTAIVSGAAGPRADAVARDFTLYLERRYDVPEAVLHKAQPTCQWTTNVSAYAAGRRQDSEKAAQLLRNRRVVDTGWTPN